MKLGKLAPKFNEKTLRFSSILSRDAIKQPPEKVFWEYLIPTSEVGMYGNDEVGDCVFADIAHHIMLVTAHSGKQITPDPKEIIKCYSAVTGYDPSKADANGDNLTDQGTNITDALNYWQTVGICGHKILGWAQLDHKNLLRRNQGVYLFGGNTVGVQLPAVAQDQFGNNQPWEVVPSDGGIGGGHCILESGYGFSGRNFETWGKGDQKASNDWSRKYMDEAYIVICHELLDWVAGTRFVNMDAMMGVLKEVAA